MVANNRPFGFREGGGVGARRGDGPQEALIGQGRDVPVDVSVLPEDRTAIPAPCHGEIFCEPP